MKKAALALLILFAFTMLPAVPAGAESAPPGTSAHSAVLMHADTGTLLYEHNADDRMLIASTTKIMTAIVVLENCALDDIVTIDERSAGAEGSSMYLRAGERYTVEDLLLGLMLVSGNDAALALAIHTAGSVEDFADMMNEKAAALGMTGTHFSNPHGLDAEDHYSTARDMAVLAAYCMENDDFARIVATRSANVAERPLTNHNKLLSLYDGCIGIKTGYTMAAGRTLVSCAERGNTRFICVTLCDRDDWDDHAALYDWAFENYEYVRVIDSSVTYRVNAVNAEETLYASASAQRDGWALLPVGAECDTRVELPPFVICPVQAGETAGQVVVSSNGQKVCSVRLVYAEDLPARESGGFLGSIERFIKNLARPIYLTGDDT